MPGTDLKATLRLATGTRVPQNGGGAIVMGADYRGLGVVRSLGRRSIPVWVLRHGDHLLAAISRYALRSLPWPNEDAESRINFLLELSQRYGLKGWVLIPTGDETVHLVSRHRELLAKHFLLTTPAWNTLRWACDKGLMHQLAKNLGVDQPWAACPQSRQEVIALDSPFPVILKARLRDQPNPLSNAKAWRADDRTSLVALYDDACAFSPSINLMVQEVIPGRGEAQFSYAALYKDGQPLAWATARRVRQFPMDFGRASTYVETVEEPRIVDPSERLLGAISFTGLVEIEYKRDPRDGRFKLLDINPRVWGWHTLCAKAGVDFPGLLWSLAHGEHVARTNTRSGVRWMRMSTDLPVAVREVQRGQLSLWSYIRVLCGPCESAIFAPDDPWPGLLELPMLASLAVKRLFRGTRI